MQFVFYKATSWRAGLTKLLLMTKLTALMILLGCLQAHSKGLAQRVTLKEKDAPLEKVLLDIHRQVGIQFFYKDEVLDKAGRITIDVEGVTVEEALDACFKGLPISFSMSGKTIVLTAKAVLPEVVPVMPLVDIHGRVVDSAGNPLVGASVFVKGTRNGTQTGKDGGFLLEGVERQAVLLVSFTGYETREVKWKGQDALEIRMLRSTSSLDEVQVIAYGTTSQRLSTGNITTIRSDEIARQPVDNPLLALEGLVPGMQITQGNGVPGSAVSIIIRGQNSINNGNDPLYVIDGVPYTSENLPGLGSILGSPGYNSGAINGQQIFGSPLSYINPLDIESISVLKDADATAIYGSRAANGAILITTKSGQSGAPKVEVNVYSGWSRVTREMSVLNLRQYLDMRYEALKNDGDAPNPNSDYDLTLWDTTHSTDWQKALIGGIAHTENAEISMSGGNAAAQYLIGADYLKEGTVFPGNEANQRGSVHFNLKSGTQNGRLKVTLTGNYAYDDNQLFVSDLSKYIFLAPDAPKLFNPDGTLNWSPNGSGFPTWTNPLAYLNETYKNLTNNLVSNALVSYRIWKGLEVKSSFGYTNMQTHEENIFPHSAIAPFLWQYVQSTANFAYNSLSSWIIEPQVTYNVNMNRGKLDVLVGSTIESRNGSSTILNSSGYSSDALMDNILNAATVTVGSTLDAMYKYAALFGRINYNWSDRYILNLTGRRDGSSRFGPASQFHDFYSGGAAWIFSGERFISQNLPFLSFGKLQISYGTTGSDQVGDYQYLDLYYSSPLTYQSVRGLNIQNLYNPNLAWEQTEKLDGGLELGFLKDRIYLSTHYFRNVCDNQLAGYHLPSTTGFAGIAANQDARVQNKGWEFVLNTQNIKSKRFQWSSSLNVTVYRNKVLSLGPNWSGYRGRLGYPLGTTWGYHYLGVDPATGIYQFADRNGKPTANPDTENVAINLSQKYYGGFKNSFSYRGFQLDILFQFVKQLGPNNLFQYFPGPFQSLPNIPTVDLNRWQKPGDIKPIERYNSDGSLYNNFSYAQTSDKAFSDASYIRLKNLSLSYLLPDRSARKIGMQSCRVYIQCQNLLTLTHYMGGDPETMSFSTLPPLRVITAGFQISL